MPTLFDALGIEDYSQPAPAPAAVSDQGDFFRGAKVALGQTTPIAKGVVGLVGATAESALGADSMLGKVAGGVKDWGLRGYTEGMQKLQPLQKDTDELTTAWDKASNGDIGALVDWAQYGLGYALGQGGEALATSLLGGVAGAVMAPEVAPISAAGGAITGLVAKGAVKSAAVSLIEKAVVKEATALMAKGGAEMTAEQAVKQATKSIASNIGSTTALLGFGGAQELGSIYPEAAAEALKNGEQLGGADIARVWAYGLAAGGLEGLTDKLGVSALTGKVKIPGAATRTGSAALGALGGVAVEGATEGAQTVLERLGAGQEPFSPEGVKDIINSAGLGAIGGGAIGGAAGALHPQVPQEHQRSADRAIAAIDAAETGDDAIAAALASQQPITMPQGLDAEGALARMERQRDADVKDLRDFSPSALGADMVNKSAAAADLTEKSTPTTGYSGPASATAVPQEPFSDRLMTVREQVSDSRVRQQVRDTLGPDALNDILYYAKAADDETLPGRTSDNMLSLAETILIRAQVQPLERTVLKQQKREQQALKANAAAPQIGLDTTPTGTITVNAAAEAAPQTRADQISLADRARALREGRGQGMTASVPKGGEAGAGVLVGEGALTPGAVRPAPAQIEATPVPGKRGAFTAAEAEAAQRKATETAAIPAIAAEQNTTAAAVKRAATVEAPTAMELALRRAAKTPEQIAEAAHEAATSPNNDRAEPTDAQKEAGNYKKGKTTINGMRVTIENPEGSTRRSKSDEKNPWEVVMPFHYGYIRGTVGADTVDPARPEQVDIGIGPKGENGRFWVINQNQPDSKTFDEHKIITGVDSADEAVALYKRGFANNFGEKVFDSVSAEMTPEAIKAKLPELEQPKPVAAAQVAQAETPAPTQPVAAPAAAAPAEQSAPKSLKERAAAMKPAATETPAERLNLKDGSPITGTSTAGATLAGEFAGYARDGRVKLRQAGGNVHYVAPESVQSKAGAAVATEGAQATNGAASPAVPAPDAAAQVASAPYADDPKRWAALTKNRRDRPASKVIQKTGYSLEWVAADRSNPYSTPEVRAVLPDGRVVGTLGVFDDGETLKGVVQVSPGHRRIGIASRMYEAAEKIIGKKFRPEPGHSADAAALWASQDRQFGGAPVLAKGTSAAPKSLKERASALRKPKEPTPNAKPAAEPEATQAPPTARTNEAEAPASVPDAGPAAVQTDGVATHADPGGKPEVATPPVVATSLRTAAAAESRKPSEMKAELLGKVDAAMAALPEGKIRDALLEVHKREMASPDEATRTAGERRYRQTLAEYGHTTFDIPGDGEFKVLNTPDSMASFRAKVESSGGFKDNQRTGPPKQSAPSSPGVVAAVSNMIEEKDFQAATDYAAAKGINLDDLKLTKQDRAALDKWTKDNPQAEPTVAVEKPEVQPEPAPAAEASAADDGTTKLAEASGVSGQVTNPDNAIDPLTPEAITASPTGRAALGWLAANAKDPAHRALADRLKEFMGDVPIHWLKTVDSAPANVARSLSGNAAGVTELTGSGGAAIWMHTGKSVNETLLLHELIHAATMRALASTKNAVLRDDIQNLLASIKSTLRDTEYTSAIDMTERERAAFFERVLKDEHELFAYAFSSPSLRRFMQNMNEKGKFTEYERTPAGLERKAERAAGLPPEPLTLWQKFVDLVRQLLGLSKLYSKRLEAMLADREARLAGFIAANVDRTLYERLDELLNATLEAQARMEGAAEPAMAAGSISAMVDKIKQAGGGTKIVGQTMRQYTPEQIQGMRNVGFEVETPTLEARATALWQDAGKKLAQGLVDQFAPVKDISKAAYGLLRLAKGASGAFEVFLQGGKLKLTDGVYDFDETQRGGVVNRLLIPLQGEHHDFFRWIAANRAERLMAAGKENLFTPADIAALKTLDQGTTSFDYTLQHGANAGKTTRDRTLIYPDSLRTFNEFNRNVLDMAEQSGLIDGEARKLWENEFYVPFYRVEDDGSIAGADIKNGAVRQQAFKSLTGRKNKLNADLLDNTLMNWAHLLDASAKNRAAKASVDAAEAMGAAAKVDGPSGKGTVWFRENGEKRFSFVEDPYLLTAISALAYNGMRSPVMTAMGAFKRALTVGVTASPFFKIRNLIRDSMQVVGTSSISPNIAGNVTRGWQLSDPQSESHFRLLAGGGTIHFGTMLEGSEAKRVQALVESGVDASTILGDGHKVQAFYRKYIEPGITAYNELGNRGEEINRASLYSQLRAQGIGHAEASLQARDLMDFSMQGSFASIRFLTQVVPFFNARIQGLYKLGRAAKEDPARFSAVIGATAAASIALLAMFSDDDDWKKREDWDRNNYWWFKFGGTAFRIPKPFEIGAMATLAERGFELAFDKEMTGTRFRTQVLALLGDNLSMNPVPQLVKPMLDVYANTNSFTGRPIETMGMERLKSDYRFTENTSMAARGVSTAANAVTGLVGKEALSPVQIDHLLQGYFGWLGSFIVGAGDVLARPATGQSTKPTMDYWKTATGGIVSELDGAQSRYVSQMYTQAKEIEQAYGTWKALVKEGKAGDAQEFKASNIELIGKYNRTERVKRQEGELNAKIRRIESGDMDPDQKRDAIRQIQQQKDRLARQLAPA